MDFRFTSLFSLAAAVLVTAATAQAGEVRFEPGDGHAQHPVFSRDGKFVAFEVNRYDGAGIDLYVSQVTGAIAKDGAKVSLPGGSSQFGSGGQVVMNPTWHPGGYAVFEGSNQGGQYRLYVKAPGGATATELLTTTQVPGNVTFPAISPDGNLVAYISNQTGNGDVRDWNRANNAFGHLTQTDGTESFPLYSADGKRLVFGRKANGTEDIFEFDLATKTEKPVVGGGGDQTRPVYAAGGRVVYFTSERGEGQWDVAVVEAGGGGKRVLAKGVRLPIRARPAVSQDGEWVVWMSDDPTQDHKVFVGKVDGSQTVEVTTQFKGCGEPALTVQNGRVLLAYTYLPQSGADWRRLYIEDITDKL